MILGAKGAMSWHLSAVMELASQPSPGCCHTDSAGCTGNIGIEIPSLTPP